MKKIIILRGLPASGKSTYAKQLVLDNPNSYKRLNRDAMREMLDASHFSRSNEKFVKRLRDWLIIEALRDGKHVIVDDTNLSEKNIRRIEQLAQEFAKDSGHEIKVEVKDFDEPLQELLERDAKRKKKVGRKTITRMYEQFKTKRVGDYSNQNTDLLPAIICDLDGTLSIMHDRSPFDGKACESDLLNQPVADILDTFRKSGHQIILLSGRTDDSMPETKRWLAKYGIKYDALYMRKTEDTRKDSIIKIELFNEHIKDNYWIKFVLDDRDQVVDMWRLELGLPCLQVYYGDF